MGRIFGVGNSLEEDTKALAVHASITDRSKGLIPGLFVNALIETGTDSVPALPQQAVVAEAGRKYLFVKDGEEGSTGGEIVFRRIEIETGLEELGYVEVLPLEEIAPDAEIAVKGTFHIHSVFKPGVDQE
jgi:cobalt-zinc-cadmium efflux system membrane fusion protein